MLNIRLATLARALAVAASLFPGVAAADPPHGWMARAAREAVHRDWVLRCGAAGCLIRTTVLAADGSEVLAIEVSADRAALALRTALPLHLPDGATLALGADPLRPVSWRTCDPAGCLAEAPLADDLRAALRRERSVEVTLTLVEGVRVRLSASLLGFSAAFDALDAARAAVAVTPP